MPTKQPPRKDKNRVPRTKRAVAPQQKDAERVAKVIARAGLGSRREIEEWITQGRVAVNGVVLESPAFTVTEADRIEVDGAPLPEKERTRLFLYHKPRGVVTTNRDPEGRTTLFEILPEGLPRLVSVGRLDLNSEGLLLLTNDGGLARVLELPETGWLRRYRVRAKGEIDQAKLDALLKGIEVDGVAYGPIEATLDRVQGANAWMTVSLREGKNREVRNVLAALGLVVNRLIRISYGPFQLGDIAEGGIEEVRTRILRDQIGAELSAAAGADFDGPLIEREIGPAPVRPPRAEPVRGAKGREAAAPAPKRGRRDEEREVESRGTVADRKGRQIKVERVVRSPDEEERPRRASYRPAEGGAPRGRSGGPDRFGAGSRSRPQEDERPARRAGPSGPRRARDDDREDFRRGDERPPRRAGAGEAPRGRPVRSARDSDEGRPVRRERPAREDFRRGDSRPPRRADAPHKGPPRSRHTEGGGFDERRGPRRDETGFRREDTGAGRGFSGAGRGPAGAGRSFRPREEGADEGRRPRREDAEGRPPRKGTGAPRRGPASTRDSGDEGFGFFSERPARPERAGKAGYAGSRSGAERSGGYRAERPEGKSGAGRAPGKSFGAKSFGAKAGGGKTGGGKRPAGSAGSRPTGSRPGGSGAGGTGRPGGRPGPKRG